MNNREILFRGKRRDNGEWVYGYYVRHAKLGVSLILNISDKEAYRVIPETVGQYIGEKDEDSKRIYEHDVIKGKWIDLNTGITKEKVSVITDIRAIPDYVSCKVIGNLHDNTKFRELIKRGEEVKNERAGSSVGRTQDVDMEKLREIQDEIEDILGEFQMMNKDETLKEILELIDEAHGKFVMYVKRREDGTV